MLTFALFFLGCPQPEEDNDRPEGDLIDEVIPEVVEPEVSAASIPLPTGQLVVRNECFQRAEDQEKAYRPTTLRPSPKPTPQGAKGGGPYPSAPPPSAAPVEAEEDAAMGIAVGSPGEAGDLGGSVLLDPAPEATRDEKKESKTREKGEPSPIIGTQVYVPPQPVLDWGAKVYLSNDDSMSLASAQRALFAVKNGKRLRTSEIRPHELLNYFSFDTAPVEPGQLFSVLGSANREGETLRVALAVQGGNPPRQPLDLTLLVDRSCSMEAEGRMDYTRKGLDLLADNLKRGDRVDLVLFDDHVCTPIENWIAGRDEPQVLKDVFRRIAPEGATDLDAGLRHAYGIQATKAGYEGRNRRIVVVTDAELNTGNVNQDLVSEVGKRYEESGIRLTGVGVGRDFNDTMLDKLTEKGKGAYVYLGSEAVVERVFGVGFDSLTRTIAHDVRFALQLPKSLAMERFYGEEASTDPTEVQPINYYANTSQVFLQDLRLDPAKLQGTDPLVLEIAYTDAATGERRTQTWSSTVGAVLEADHHNLDKARALMAFSDLLLARAMGSDACGSPLTAYRDRITGLGDDVEIGYVSGLLGTMCKVELGVSEAAPPGAVDFKVNVDSDTPISEVALECSKLTVIEKLNAGDRVASFRVRPAACQVRLTGNVEMRHAVTVPEVGGSVRCVARGGRLSCL